LAFDFDALQVNPVRTSSGLGRVLDYRSRGHEFTSQRRGLQASMELWREL
jgi:hypothetical protein